MGRCSSVPVDEAAACPFRAILQAAPDALIVTDLDGQVILANRQAERSFGYQPGELQGRPIRAVIADGLGVLQSAGEASTLLEGTGHRKDGSTVPLELTRSAFEGPDGPGFITAIRDVSLRKAEDSRLATMDLRYRALVEAAPDVVVAVNLQGEIVLMNLKAEQQFGYQRHVDRPPG